MSESKALALFGSAELSTAEVDAIAAKVGKAGEHILASGHAIADYNATRNTAISVVGESHESTAKTLAVQIALLKSEYTPPKGKAKGDAPTYGDIAKTLTISPTYFSQLGAIGAGIYLDSTPTAHTLADWFSPSLLIKLLPLKDGLLKEAEKGIEDGSLTPDMTQSDLVKWVDERITHEPEIEPEVIIRDPITGEEFKRQLSVYLEETGIDPDRKVGSVKTGYYEELSPSLKLEWTALTYLSEDMRTASVLWVRKHRIPKPTKDETPTVLKLDPMEALKQSLKRTGYDESAIDMVLSMNRGE